MRTLTTIGIGLAGGFVLGLVLSQIIAIVGLVVFNQIIGIKFLPIYLALIGAGITPLVAKRRKPNAR